MSLVVAITFQLMLLMVDGLASNYTKNCKLGPGTAERDALNLLEPLTNKNYSAVHQMGGDTYTYYFQVCGDANGTPGAGLVQVDAQQKKVVIGYYNTTQAISGSDWVMLTYGLGEKYDKHCSQEHRRALIMISCDRNVAASELKVVVENRDRSESCFYLFELDSSAVCPVVPSKLSAGSVLLIIAVCCLAVYLIGGFLYMRLVVGAKGVEQFPHYAFWSEIGNLSADGCDFVCRSRGNRQEPPTYTGVATEPLGEEPEERDDHLLPM
ncbi:cation-dependent mannose-6-phosphate receptor [Sardina pilchardus]|uniref:cation-dependent mannose-6-phosphate receptor n=1 Tax=Sardina pilchardus TaxID=27697 RepID=UPI002E13792E